VIGTTRCSRREKHNGQVIFTRVLRQYGLTDTGSRSSWEGWGEKVCLRYRGLCTGCAEPPRFVGTVVPQWAPLSKALGRLGRRQELQIVYEADPCGYTLAQELRAHGYACEVIAPAKIARRPGDRIKTDRRDALLLARAARARELVRVAIPDERDEGVRGSRHTSIRCAARALFEFKELNVPASEADRNLNSSIASSISRNASWRC